MITVSDSPFDISEITSKYPQDSIEKQLLDKMNISIGKYSYTNLDQLIFELTLRKNIVDTALDLHNSDLSFSDFKSSKCNTEYWNRTDNGGFRLKDNVIASKAITDIFINGNKYATECATAMMIVYYKALLDTYGDELFNKIFTKIYLMNWNTEEPLLKNATSPKAVDDILLGDRVYFNNPDFDPETPAWRGENAIVLPDSLYYGHGIGITTADKMVEILNSKRKKNASTLASLLEIAGRPDFKRLSDIYYNPPQYSRLVWLSFPESNFVI